MRDTVWITKQGERLLVSQMETRHIVNCINKIIRDNWRVGYLERLQLELLIRQIKQEG